MRLDLFQQMEIGLVDILWFQLPESCNVIINNYISNKNTIFLIRLQITEIFLRAAWKNLFFYIWFLVLVLRMAVCNANHSE